eukprot:355292-Chlamydomonas_euryale.AAC.10
MLPDLHVAIILQRCAFDRHRCAGGRRARWASSDQIVKESCRYEDTLIKSQHLYFATGGFRTRHAPNW